VIKNDVPPVDFNSDLVDVADDFELERSYLGDPVEEFLLDVQLKSTNEVFKVTEDLEFSFQRPERSRAPRDIDNTQWVTHNIGEESKETVNQVTVFYDDGNSAVTVDNSSDQLNIEDNLQSDGPGQQGKTVTQDDIDTADDARDVAEQILQRRGATLTGSVSTFGLADAQPGQVIDITVTPRGIDGEFRIAENQTRWIYETNELTVVQKNGGDDDILIEQSKTIDRVQNRPADNSVTPDRVTDSRPTATLEITLDASASVQKGVWVNSGLNRIRDGFVNEDNVNNVNLLFSESTTVPVRSDESVSQVVDTQSAALSDPGVGGDDDEAEYEASTTATGIRTIAAEDADTGDLLCVALTDGDIGNETVTLKTRVSFAEGDETTTGCVQLSDNTAQLLTDSSAQFPGAYAYGDGTQTPKTDDLSLTNRVVKQDLTNITLDEGSSTSEFQELI
jgi:hypothetical protein